MNKNRLNKKIRMNLKITKKILFKKKMKIIILQNFKKIVNINKKIKKKIIVSKVKIWKKKQIKRNYKKQKYL